jgi:hypothetical protein
VVEDHMRRFVSSTGGEWPHAVQVLELGWLDRLNRQHTGRWAGCGTLQSVPLWYFCRAVAGWALSILGFLRASGPRAASSSILAECCWK